MSSPGTFVWRNADQLRGVLQASPVGNAILPMTILRRLDCLMAPSRVRMFDLTAQHDNQVLLAAKVRQECGLTFHHGSEYDLARLIAAPDGLAPNLLDYLARFSSNVDVVERFTFETEVATLVEKKRLLLVVRQFAEAANETAGEGTPEPDPTLRDSENAPFGWAPPVEVGDSRHGESHRDDVIKQNVEHEVLPHMPDAWVDRTKTRTGYEIPFSRAGRRSALLNWRTC